MSGRHRDEYDYSSRDNRHTSRREQPREREQRDRVDSGRERRMITDDRMDRDIRIGDSMDTRQDPRIDRLDPRMDIRPDQRTTTTSRLIDPRPERMLDNRSQEPDTGSVMLPDIRAGDPYYRPDPRAVPARSPYAREDEYDGAPDLSSGRNRPMMDAPMRNRDREPTRPEYTEYFCPGDGIEREVIQHEICKYLGQDATLRTGRNSEGRSGYWVKAYRPFTSNMERSLREETIKWMRDRERRQRQGRAQGSYAEMQARQESRHQPRFPGEMDIDDEMDFTRAPMHRDPDPRAMPAGRVAIPTSTGYPPEPGFPAQYTISSNQSGYPPGQPAYYSGSEREQPRSFGVSGGNSPPSITSRALPGGYSQPGYQARTGPPVTSAAMPTSYDPRRDMMGFPTGYEPSRRRN